MNIFRFYLRASLTVLNLDITRVIRKSEKSKSLVYNTSGADFVLLQTIVLDLVFGL